MINLFQNYYEENNVARRNEIDFCISKNMENQDVNLILIESNTRMTYSDFFRIINNYTGSDDINIIANLDIYLNETIKLLTTMSHDQAFAICRWELEKNGGLRFADRPDSQDTWIFKGKIKNVFGDFNLGYCGCDNRIAYEIQKAGYLLKNPGKTIQTIHAHSSGIRNYKYKGKERKDFEVGPPYLTITPTTL